MLAPPPITGFTHTLEVTGWGGKLCFRVDESVLDVSAQDGSVMDVAGEAEGRPKVVPSPRKKKSS